MSKIKNEFVKLTALAAILVLASTSLVWAGQGSGSISIDPSRTVYGIDEPETISITITATCTLDEYYDFSTWVVNGITVKSQTTNPTTITSFNKTGPVSIMAVYTVNPKGDAVGESEFPAPQIVLTVYKVEKVTVTPKEAAVIIGGEPKEFTAKAIDTNGNDVTTYVTDRITWSVSGGIGEVNPTKGSSTNFTSVSELPEGEEKLVGHIVASFNRFTGGKVTGDATIKVYPEISINIISFPTEMWVGETAAIEVEATPSPDLVGGKIVWSVTEATGEASGTFSPNNTGNLVANFTVKGEGDLKIKVEYTGSGELAVATSSFIKARRFNFNFFITVDGEIVIGEIVEDLKQFNTPIEFGIEKDPNNHDDIKFIGVKWELPNAADKRGVDTETAQGTWKPTTFPDVKKAKEDLRDAKAKAEKIFMDVSKKFAACKKKRTAAEKGLCLWVNIFPLRESLNTELESLQTATENVLKIANQPISVTVTAVSKRSPKKISKEKTAKVLFGLSLPPAELAIREKVLVQVNIIDEALAKIAELGPNKLAVIFNLTKIIAQFDIIISTVPKILDLVEQLLKV